MSAPVQTDPLVSPPKLRPLQIGGMIVAAVVFLFPFFVDIPGLEEMGERMLSIFLMAIVLWVTEAIPLYATAVMVIFLEVLLISDRAILPVTEGAMSYASYFGALANPVIILFLGGFMIADGAEKFGLDKNIAAIFMKPFAGSARKMMLGLMLITGVLSMFMSNTATTAAMFAVVLPILAALPEGKTRAAVALSIPVSANIGGMGTPVGTPPNAIAVGALASKGVTVSFLDWMILSVPLMLVLLFGAWFWLSVYVPKNAPLKLEMKSEWNMSRQAKIYYVVAGTTVALWMTEPLHGISSNIVGFLPVVLLLALRVMADKDIHSIDWPVLWLVAGGIALGQGVGASGLDEWLLSRFDWASMSQIVIITILVALGLGMSNVISHSASANLLVPLALSFSATIGIDMVMIAVVLALSTSLGMSMPISTPPNAIGYATGQIPLKTMAVTGLVVGIGGAVLLAYAMPPLWSLLGLIP